MTTELPSHQSLAPSAPGAALRYRTPLWTRTAVTAIHGRPRVEEVELTDLDTGGTRTLAATRWSSQPTGSPTTSWRVMGGARAGPGHARAGGRRRAAHLAAGRLRRGQPAPRRRDRRRGRAQRAATRRAAAALLAATGDWPARARARSSCEAPLALDLAERGRRRGRAAPPPPRGRFALRSREFLPAPADRDRAGRAPLWSGRWRGSCPAARCACPTTGRRPWIQHGGPVTVRLATAG